MGRIAFLAAVFTTAIWQIYKLNFAHDVGLPVEREGKPAHCFANQGEVFPAHHFGGSARGSPKRVKRGFGVPRKPPPYLAHHFSTKGDSSHPPRAVILERVGGLARRGKVIRDHPLGRARDAAPTAPVRSLLILLSPYLVFSIKNHADQ